jgi:hypothetical protein
MAQKRTGTNRGGVIRIIGEMPRPDDASLSNGYTVSDLLTCVGHGDLNNAPHFIRKVLVTGAWRHYANPDTSEIIDYGEDEFDKFARARWPLGLKQKDGIDTLIHLCELYSAEEAAPEALRRLRELLPKAAPAIHAGPGRGKKTDGNAIGFTKPRRGTTAASTLARLKRDTPELADKVVSGEMSANAAAIAAGFRVRTVQVKPTVEGFNRAIQKYLTEPERAALAGYLGETS